jgi:predicted N-acetyltransferase YhbS/predicted acetyltransferase
MRLRPYKACDAGTIVKWIKNEYAFRQWSADKFEAYPINAEMLNEHYDMQKDNDTFFEMTAFDESGVVGHFIIRLIDEEKMIARFGFIIVDDTIKGKGYGKEMLELACTYAFDILKVEKITLGVFANNESAYYCYKAVGFRAVSSGVFPYLGDNWEYFEMEKGKKPKSPLNIIIREETEKDYYGTELMTQRAFWNKHHLGCDEHYLVHLLRTHVDYIPEISLIAEVEGRVAGAILYSKARVEDNEKIHEVLTFGPLCVDPDYWSMGIGGELLKVTMKMAGEMGYKAIVIYGEPDYYPLHGFVTCDNYGITTPDGKNFSAFMCIELVPGGLDGIHGKFYESEVFEKLVPEEVNTYNEKFPVMQKIKLPGQWD